MADVPKLRNEKVEFSRNDKHGQIEEKLWKLDDKLNNCISDYIKNIVDIDNLSKTWESLTWSLAEVSSEKC